MFKSWRQIDSPQRAPRLTLGIVTAIIARAVEKADVIFAAVIGLAFHCLLRTGEFLALQYKDLELSSTTGICSLLSSKSGLRTGTEEAVAIRDPLVLNLLRTAQSLYQHCPGLDSGHIRHNLLEIVFAVTCHIFVFAIWGWNPTASVEEGLHFYCKKEYPWMLFYFVGDGNPWELPDCTLRMAWHRSHICEFPIQTKLDWPFTLLNALLRPYDRDRGRGTVSKFQKIFCDHMSCPWNISCQLRCSWAVSNVAGFFLWPCHVGQTRILRPCQVGLLVSMEVSSAWLANARWL